MDSKIYKHLVIYGETLFANRDLWNEIEYNHLPNLPTLEGILTNFVKQKFPQCKNYSITSSLNPIRCLSQINVSYETMNDGWKCVEMIVGRNVFEINKEQSLR